MEEVVSSEDTYKGNSSSAGRTQDFKNVEGAKQNCSPVSLYVTHKCLRAGPQLEEPSAPSTKFYKGLGGQDLS